MNFNAISGNSAISKYEKSTVIDTSVIVLPSIASVIAFPPQICTIGIVKKNSVFAGVGKPIKLFDCLVSILNLANLNPDRTVIKKPTSGQKFRDSITELKSNNSSASRMALYTIIPGTKPKETISAKESNCFPSSEDTFNKRATNPSKKSATAAVKINTIPKEWELFRKAKTAKQPQAKFVAVSKFGMSDFKTIFSKDKIVS